MIKGLKEKSWLAYPVLFVLVMLISHFIFKKFGLFYTSIESARYMLSAMVQSEAAILAIVITLSLVAVQLTASSYSPRVIEIFRKSPDLWILMVSYIIAIVYGLGILKMIGEYKVSITFSYFLSIFCFLALIPYTLNTINLLKPSTIIDKLSRKITKESLVNKGKEDPIQPIIDIVCGSMMKYDYKTTRDGLNVISNKICNIFQKEKFNKAEEREVSKRIYDHFIEVGKLAVSRDDEYSTIAVITNITEMGKISTRKKLEGAADWAVVALRLVGILAAEGGLKWPVNKAAWSLKDVGMIAAEKKLVSLVEGAAEALGVIGKTVVEKGLEDKAKWVAWHLGELEKAAAKKGFPEETISMIDNAIKEIKWFIEFMVEGRY